MRRLLRHLPNLLTCLRIALAPAAAISLWMGGASPVPVSGATELRPDATLLAMVLIIIAAATDWLDGFAARALGATSRLGLLLDPMADKALCWSLLLAYAAVSEWNMIVCTCAIVIVARDTTLSTVRLTAPDGQGPMPSRLAKTKTALEMAVLALGPAVAYAGTPPLASTLWLAGLIVVGGLSVATGLGYLRARS